MNPIVKRAVIGMTIGALLGVLPGLFSAVVGNFVSAVQATIHTSNASSLLVYIGLMIGGGAGAIVAALAGTAPR